jgi:hypothetical protein
MMNEPEMKRSKQHQDAAKNECRDFQELSAKPAYDQGDDLG